MHCTTAVRNLRGVTMTSPTKQFVNKYAAARIAIWFSLTLAHPCLAQAGGPELPDPGSTSISREQQQQLGFQAAAEVYKQMPVLPDSSPETQYVRQLGQRMVAT